MARERIFTRETSLHHPIDGWKTFPPGETDPGPAWSEIEGGAPTQGARDAATLKEMADLTARAEKAEAIVQSRAHDMARLEQLAADATNEAAALKARANDAEKAHSEADANVLRIAAERDQANGNEGGLRNEVAALKGRIGELEAALAAVDGDGDGAPGGSKPESEDPDAAEKAELRAQLKALDQPTPHHKLGVEKLRALVEAATAP